MAVVLCGVAFIPVASFAGPANSMAAPKSRMASPSQQAKSALDVPIEAIAASVSGCAILDKDFPGMRSHAMYGFFKSMSLHQVAALSKGRMTPEMLAQAHNDLAALSLAAVPPPAVLPDIDDMEPEAKPTAVSESQSK
jgi:hypothetical protein